jgi:hypothetical protein
LRVLHAHARTYRRIRPTVSTIFRPLCRCVIELPEADTRRIIRHKALLFDFAKLGLGGIDPGQ